MTAQPMAPDPDRPAAPRKGGLIRIIVTAMAICIVIAALYLAIALTLDSRLAHAFAGVAIGQPRDEVDRRMGTPVTILHAGEPYEGEIWPGPWHEARIYANPLPSPRYCERVVFFDDKGTVISTATIGSP